MRAATSTSGECLSRCKAQALSFPLLQDSAIFFLVGKFDNFQYLICRCVLELLNDTGRPDDFNGVGLRVFCQAGVNRTAAGNGVADAGSPVIVWVPAVLRLTLIRAPRPSKSERRFALWLQRIVFRAICPKWTCRVGTGRLQITTSG